MDRTMRTLVNTIYNEAGEGGKGITVHFQDFSLYSKSLLEKMNDRKQKQNLCHDQIHDNRTYTN